ncbi:MAG: PAS domain S-box protein [Leptolyngbyaceae cyanobacterium HOT.MB2.61]|nr:PAS domain S-box protein [Leptolyngbyaceae cyanobacterium HOT.MB2.61]
MIGKAVNKARHKFRLRTTLVVPFVLQIVTAVGLIGYLSLRNGQRTVNDLVSQLQHEISSRVNERVQLYLETPHLVNQINEDAARLGVLNFNDLEGARSYLWKQVLRFQSIGHIGLANEKGQYLRVGWVNRSVGSEQPQLAQQLKPGTGDLIYYKLDKNGNPIAIARKTPNYDVRQRPLYKAALKHNRAAWSDVYINFGCGSLQINASSPYYDSRGNLLGVLTCQMGLDQIRGFLQTLQVGQSGQVFLIEPSGELIATSLTNQPLTTGTGKEQKRLNAQESSNPIMHQSMAYLNAHHPGLHNLQKATQMDFRLDSQRYFLEVSPLRDDYGLNWLTVVVVPEADFMAQIKASTRNTVLLSLGALGVAIAIGILTARWITHPILRVSQASDQLAQGNLNQQVEPSTITEIDTLANSFNGMTRQLKDSFNALRQSEATNRALIDAMPDLLLRVNRQGKYLGDAVGANRLKLFSGGTSSIANSTVQDSLPAAQAQQRMAAIAQALDTGKLQIYKQQLVINGQVIDEEVRVVVTGEDEVLIIVRDISDRKRAEEALRIAEGNYRSIFENALEGIVQSSPEGQFISVNPAMAKIYGYDCPQEMLHTITDIKTQIYVDPADQLEFQRQLDEHAQTKGLEYRVYQRDGNIIWIQEDTRAVRDNTGHLLYYEGIVQDITDRKRREDELRRQLEELKIEIDQKKREKEVAMLTESTYFQEVQQELAEVNLDEFWS